MNASILAWANTWASAALHRSPAPMRGNLDDGVLPAIAQRMTVRLVLSSFAAGACGTPAWLNDVVCRRSAEHGKPARTRQPVEGGLHHRSDMSVDLVDIGIFTELGHIDGFQHLHDDLAG